MKSDKLIGVVGGGVVGRATARAYLEHVKEVRVFDVMRERRTHTFSDVMACDVIFLCIPEGQVDGWCRQHATVRRDANYVIKSTVPIGTTHRLATQLNLTSLVHSPEFLTERCAMMDAQQPARNVIGYPYGCGNPSFPVEELYMLRFPGVITYTMPSDESEALKLIQNAFFATKVAFFNEMFGLCDKLNMRYGRILEALLADGRINSSHTEVPGPDGMYGFGGKCLPKDLATLIRCFMSEKIGYPILDAVQMRNVIDRKR